ncbi:benzoate-CoA ligase family protein, partial [Planktomarina sp.]|nr:benzoate-CoA ligase family protein [Planktomarina sp.]
MSNLNGSETHDGSHPNKPNGRVDTNLHSDLIIDPVSKQSPGAIEIGFDRSTHKNCSEILWQNLSKKPDKIALIGPAGILTYREVIADAARWGNAFISAGVQRGERIAFLLDDTPTFIAAFYGAVRAGFVPVLMNIQTKPDVLAYFLKDADAKLAIVEGNLADVYSDVTREGLELPQTILVNTDVEHRFFLNVRKFLKTQKTELDCADTNPSDMAFWMYSSGTTGLPKGIVHLHHDMAYVQASFGDNVLKLSEDDICYSVPKSYFAYGFGNSLIFPISQGATALMMPGPPHPKNVLDAIETYKPTVLFGLPTLFTALSRSDDILNRDLGSLRQSMSAAEILSEEVYNAWKRKVGHGPTEGLGSTEMLHVYLSNKLNDHRIGAAGARVSGFEIKLETPHGTPVDSGQEGVMYVRGDSSAPIYWRRPDKTRDTMRGEWVYTGDRFIEHDGYYYFQGRADDLIKISGQWVWPLEVERCLNEHPEVHECAVLAHQLDDKRMALRA